MTTPAAVLWDMDGTLIDSEPYWIGAEYELVEAHGGTWSDHHADTLIGSDLLDSGAYIRDHGPVPLEPAEIVEFLIDRVVAGIRREIPWQPGARELLEALGSAGIPCALVTMSWRRVVEPVLEQLPGAFAAVITGDEVANGKPHPEPYLTAARALGVAPAECVAIEDSDTGVRSAVAAGCQVLVVPNHRVTIEPGERRHFAPSLTGVGVDDLPRKS